MKCPNDYFINFCFKKNLIYYIFVILIIVLGLFLRCRLFLYAHLLNEDEIAIHFNLLTHNFLYCFKSQDWLQMAPPLFLVISKIMILFLGKGILAIRFFPFICGIGVLVSFYFLVKKTFKSNITILASTLFFAILPQIVFYSNQLKPYISDVFIFILLFLFYEKIDVSKPKNFVFWLFIFFICPFISFPSLIAIGSIIILKVIEIFTENKSLGKACLSYFFKYCLLGLTALGSAIILYKINTSNILKMYSYWDGGIGFMAFSYDSIKAHILSFFNFCLIEDYYSFYLVLFGVIYSLFSRNKILILSTLALILQIFASTIHLYPFAVRLSLFLTPCFILLMMSLADIEDKFSDNRQNFLMIIKSLFVITLLGAMINPYQAITSELKNNFSTYDPIERRIIKKEETKKVLDLYKNNDRIICFVDFHLLTDYYNKINSYNRKLDYFDIKYELGSDYVLNSITDEINNNSEKNYWIYGIADSFLTDISMNYDDLEELIKSTKREYIIYPIKNQKIYYLKANMSSIYLDDREEAKVFAETGV